MSTQSETPTLLATLLLALTLLMGGVWWSAERLQMGHLLSIGSGLPGGATPLSSAVLQERLSDGHRLLIATGATPEKYAGVQAIAQGNINAAIPYLETAIATNPNDPEALIYLNNARLQGRPTYTLAVIAPIRTDLDRALEILRGAAQAQQEVNQRDGINGRSLRILLVDDGEDGAIAAQLADHLIRDPSVLGVVGHTTHTATAAARDRYGAAGLVAISPFDSAIAPSHSTSPQFRTIPSDFVTARALADHLLNRLHQSAAAVFYADNSDDSRSLRDELATALSLNGGKIVQDYDLAHPDFDPSEQVNQAAMQGATALVVLPDLAQRDRALQVIRANQNRLHLLASAHLYTAKTLEMAGPEAVGMTLAIPWHAHIDAETPFVRRSRDLWNGEVNWRTALTYDAMQAFIVAMEQGPTRQGIHQTLQHPDFFAQGGTGIVRFLPTGDRNQGIQLVRVQPGFVSGFGYDFVPIPTPFVFPEPPALGRLREPWGVTQHAWR
ncbi:ABC transporter substrate-binding protein [Vacuolonema iberomarrocanum]|uniref:ABC transporter substrate-binding protein n=1 Tax=Vacuolonema iberomarrocanum TaxID=3454632 RepID=UPI0019E8A512|nr:ABC transporter substrate-binding protein [filamentous cyanobacterium LEGE 07170]